MIRRSSLESLRRTRILLDTSFILPFFGVRVKEVPERVVDAILKTSGRITYLYPKLLIPELIGKLAKECIKARRAPDFLRPAIESFLAQVDVVLVDPTSDHLLLAMELRRRGHTDIFDCLAYATAKYEGALFLTLDHTFVRFLREQGFDVSFIIDCEKFLSLIRDKVLHDMT